MLPEPSIFGRLRCPDVTCRSPDRRDSRGLRACSASTFSAGDARATGAPARKTLALGCRGVPGFCGRWIDCAAAGTLVVVVGPVALLPVDRAGQPAVAAVVSGR
jgi:hypothetical protein